MNLKRAFIVNFFLIFTIDSVVSPTGNLYNKPGTYFLNLSGGTTNETVVIIKK